MVVYQTFISRQGTDYLLSYVDFFQKLTRHVAASAAKRAVPTLGADPAERIGTLWPEMPDGAPALDFALVRSSAAREITQAQTRK